jgi:myosin heavy subunit
MDNIQESLNKITDTIIGEVKTKCEGQDYDKTHVSMTLDEAFNSIQHIRNTLADLNKKGLWTSIPKAIQVELTRELDTIIDYLNKITEGNIDIVSLIKATEGYEKLLWQYHLNNLSSKVLGYETKMEEIKRYEAEIKRTRTEIQKALEIKQEIETLVQTEKTKLQETETTFTETRAKADVIVAELDQKLIELSTRIKKTDDDLASAIQRFAAEVTSTTQKIDRDITTKTQQVESELSRLIQKNTTELNTLAQQTDASAKALTQKAATDLDTLTQQTDASLKSLLQKLETDSKAIIQESDAHLKGASQRTDTALAKITAQEASAQQLLATVTANDSFVTSTRGKIEAFFVDIESQTEALKRLKDNADNTIEYNNTTYSDMMKKLKETETEINKQMQMATGVALFGAFKKRQDELNKSKKPWARGMFTFLLASVVGTLALIYWRESNDSFFYYKLALALPLLAGALFCEVQYSRERRLEEEYAFKANISVSLKPYQTLVEELIKNDESTPKAEYTKFIIDSINKVFNSPTEKIFDDSKSASSSDENIAKQINGVVEPLINLLKSFKGIIGK